MWVEKEAKRLEKKMQQCMNFCPQQDQTKPTTDVKKHPYNIIPGNSSCTDVLKFQKFSPGSLSPGYGCTDSGIK